MVQAPARQFERAIRRRAGAVPCAALRLAFVAPVQGLERQFERATRRRAGAVLCAVLHPLFVALVQGLARQFGRAIRRRAGAVVCVRAFEPCEQFSLREFPRAAVGRPQQRQSLSLRAWLCFRV